jgi:hypothetical protein
MFGDLPDINVLLKRVLQRHSNDIEALNKAQLSKGERADGSRLPPYSKSYLKTRKKFGRPTAPMDLNLTGKFYEKFFTQYFDSYLNIGSKDGKEPILEQMFGYIHGLTPESIDKLLWEIGVADELIQEFINEWK